MENTIENLIKDFYSKDGIKRKKARYELVKIGKPTVAYLAGLLDEPKEYVRWEAIKTLSQISVPESIPVLISALESEDFDIRWLAAEGLIDIGKKSIRPLLESIVLNQDSNYLLEGAHHVLKDLEFKHVFVDDQGIIKKIESYNLHPEVALAAEKLLSIY